MTSPDLLFLNKLDVNRITVNQKAYENKSFGYTYNYLNYQGINDLEVQMPVYLTSNTGIKRWENDSGNASYTTMLQFPCIDGRQFDEDRTARLLPDDQIPMKYDPINKEIRPRTSTEITRELETFQQFCLIEDRARQGGKITDDLRKFTWNGIIQVRNKRDKEDNVLEGEFHPPSIKFQIGTKKQNRHEIDLICTNKETGMEVDYSEIPPFSLLNAVFTLGRIHRKTRSVPQPCGLHMYMIRVTYYPPKMLLSEGNETVDSMREPVHRNNRFLTLEEDEPTQPEEESDVDTVVLENDMEIDCKEESRKIMETSGNPIKGVC